jgi:hypothetical protein
VWLIHFCITTTAVPRATVYCINGIGIVFLIAVIILTKQTG